MVARLCGREAHYGGPITPWQLFCGSALAPTLREFADEFDDASGGEVFEPKRAKRGSLMKQIGGTLRAIRQQRKLTLREVDERCRIFAEERVKILRKRASMTVH
jgi:hypothetical protein